MYNNEAFVELEKHWKNSSKVKSLRKIRWVLIYRKRVWRRRIVFSCDDNLVSIFIIEIEKSTKKDYNIWRKYILKETNYAKW